MFELLPKYVVIACMLCLISTAVSAETFKLNTDDTSVRFAVMKGVPVITGLFAVKDSHDWVSDVPEIVLPTTIEINGQAKAVAWKYADSATVKGSISFTYRCDDPKLEAVSTWTAHSGPGPVEHSAVLYNKSCSAVRFTPTPTIALALDQPKDHKLELWWVHKGAGYTPEEGGTFTDPVADGYSKVLRSGPYSEDDERRDAIPWFSLHDADGKHGLYGGIEFSGWSDIAVSKPANSAVSLTMGLQIREGTKTQVNPGNSFEFPTCFIGAYEGEVDDGCNRLHRWVETHLRPPMPDGVTPVLVNNSWGSGMAVDEALAHRMIDDCAELGIELYHVDAGWYVDVGNWHSSPQKLPKGLEEIADYTHSKGLKFGLWVGWTQGGSAKNAGPDVLSVFSPEQKNWFGQDYPEDWHNWEFTGMPVCLGSPEARAWCLNDLRRMIKQYKLDLLEHDQIMMIDACSRDNHEHIANDPVDVSRSNAEGYYEIYDQLRKENPKLMFEDCVNGGRLVDYGVARRVHYICVTDSYDQWTCRRAFYDASYPLPPSMIELYLANIHGDSLASFKCMLRSATIGWATIMIDTSQWNAEQHEAAKKEFALYKQRLRPLIASGNLYHVLPRPNGKRWEGFQYHDPNNGDGAVFVFRAAAESDTQTIKLRGLDPKKRYCLEAVDGSVANEIKTGKELMESGLAVRLTEKETSDIIFLSAAR